jgi:arabinofuranosyltransferase
LSAYLLLSIAVILAYTWYISPLASDHAMISYRYSQRLLNGDGLTWNDGEFVEGYSNLLWVLIVATGGLVQPDLLLVGWVVGVTANICALLALFWTFRRTPGGAPLFAVLSGLLVLSLSTAFKYWGVGGLETPLVGAILAWALATIYRMEPGTWNWVCPSLLLGLLAITRVDGILFSAGIAIALVLRDGFNRTTTQLVARLLAFPFIFLCAQVAFRLAYYGTFVPNTAHAKLAFTIERVMHGGLYLAKGALVNIVPLMVILVTILLLWRSQQREMLRRSLLFLIPGLVWLAYVGVIGGDFFLFQRHWMPALVCFTFALSHLVSGFPHVAPRRFAILATVAAALYLVFQNIVPVELERGQRLQLSAGLSNIWRVLTSYTPGPYRHWYLECRDSGQFVRTAFDGQRPLLAVYHAGCLPYRTQFPSLDMYGLTDSYIAHHRPRDMGKGLLGHELGDGGYVLSRKPDLIEYVDEAIDCQFSNDWCRIQREMAERAEFRQLYRLIYFSVGSGIMPFWTRIEDGRIGIVRSTTTIYIPGFLLAGTPGTRATLDSDQMMLVTELDHGEAAIENVYLPAGTWEVSLIAEAPSNLQLVTTPQTETTAMQPHQLRIVSNGSTRSFRVLGGRGKVHAIVAKVVD